MKDRIIVSSKRFRSWGGAFVVAVLIFSWLFVTPLISSKIFSFILQKNVYCYQNTGPLFFLTHCYDTQTVNGTPTSLGISGHEIEYLSILANIMEWFYLFIIFYIFYRLHKILGLKKGLLDYF